eukprot:TRINITY_DN6656_c0_g1_i1.p1 TRINITY_DN6656_c0_g1~~TRINITY_DN6656_c0_g1_i1.p1  ORF type:complete len:921 (-),score=167.02 TRINITY_DN6656_c0_g1_i1:104-2866(-)
MTEKEPQTNGSPANTEEEEEGEIITPPDNTYFYEQLVEVAMGIIVDCKNVVETVVGINTVDDTLTGDSEQKKENFVQAVKRVPNTAALLTKIISKFVSDNKDFYVDEKEYTDLFRALEQSGRTVKQSVLTLVRMATVSAFNTKAIASTVRTQSMLESHCKNVALGIKKVKDSAEKLKVMEEEEEEDWIKTEAEELAKSIASTTITLAKQCSIKLREMAEFVQSNSQSKEPMDERMFVDVVKEASTSISKLGEFAVGLGISDTDIKKSTISLIKTARQAWESKSAADITELSSRQSVVAQSISKVVLAAKGIDTTELVRQRLNEDYAKKEEAKSGAANPLPSGPNNPAPQTLANIKNHGANNSSPNLKDLRENNTHVKDAISTNGSTSVATLRSNLQAQATATPSSSNTETLVVGTAGVTKIKMSMDEMKKKIDAAKSPPPTGGQPTPLLSNSPRSPDTLRASAKPGHVLQIGSVRPPIKPGVEGTIRQVSARARPTAGLARATSRKITKAPAAEQKALSPAKKEQDARLSKYTAQDVDKITKLQRRIKRWYRIHKFRNLALEYLTSDASEKWRKRNMSIREIITTERTYVTELEDLNQVIIEPLREGSHSFVSEKQIDELFSSLESIECLHVQFLADLEERMEIWPCSGKIADVVLKHYPVMNLYTEYISKYDRQVDLLQELEGKKQWKDWIKSKNAKKSLVNYLILPVQRIPRYEMLLSQLLKLTPDDHVDHADITKALTSIQELAIRADRKRSEDDNRKNIQEVQRSVNGAPLHFSLLVSQRVLIREGILEIASQHSGKKDKSEKLLCYLFNDMFLLTSTKDKATIGAASLKAGNTGTGPQVIKERAKSKFKAVVYFKERCTVERNNDVEAGKGGFKLVDQGNNNTYVCTADSTSECDFWIKDIEEQLKEQAWRKILY